MPFKILTPFWVVLIVSLPTLVVADNASGLRIAVASNFINTMRLLADEYEAQSDNRVTLISGSSGKLSIQILQGAPFDVFFSANAYYPQLLEKQEQLEEQAATIKDSRYTYAVGRLLLWCAQLVDRQSLDQPCNSQVLLNNNHAYIAIANPKLAPYGKAAQQVLKKLNLFKPLNTRLVRGENINQVLQFVSSGNAAFGFIAHSQWQQMTKKNGQVWRVPQHLYQPIEQQAVLVKESPQARDFWYFMQSEKARTMIQNAGYVLSQEQGGVND